MSTPCSILSLQRVTGKHDSFVTLNLPNTYTSLAYSLREMDIELMRRLSPRVNVIPVIGKADSLTPSELKGFKKRIMEDIEYYGIPIYNFPYDVEEDDEETIADNSELRVSFLVARRLAIRLSYARNRLYFLSRLSARRRKSR